MSFDPFDERLYTTSKEIIKENTDPTEPFKHMTMDELILSYIKERMNKTGNGYNMLLAMMHANEPEAKLVKEFCDNLLVNHLDGRPKRPIPASEFEYQNKRSPYL